MGHIFKKEWYWEKEIIILLYISLFQIDFEHFKDNFVRILCQSTIERVEHHQDVALNNSVHEQFMDADQFDDAEEEESDDLHEEENEEEEREVEKHEEEETKEMVDTLGMKTLISYTTVHWTLNHDIVNHDI